MTDQTAAPSPAPATTSAAPATATPAATAAPVAPASASAAPAPVAPASAAPAGPTHYDVLLSAPFPIPGTSVVIRAGRSVVIAAVVDQMPAEIIVSKTPAAA